MPLPPLARDDDDIYPTGHVEVPWYRAGEPAKLTVMNEEDGGGKRPPEASPLQVAAFERTVTGVADLRGPILRQFREFVPELEKAE